MSLPLLLTPQRRALRGIALAVLVWFALFLAAAVIAPLFKPLGTQLVCSAMGGMKMVQDGADNEGQSTASVGLECPLCAHVDTPPAPAPALRHPPASALAHALRPQVAAHIAWHTRSPLPPRGPPRVS